MLSSFKSISLSYKKATVEVRELMSLDESGCKSLLQGIKGFTSASDVFVLSTCNRTEIFYSDSYDLSDSIIKLIGVTKGINNILKYKPYFELFNDPKEATNHLFRVAMGLESKVIGDMQISNQVKNAYQWSADMEMAGPFLHRLLHSVFFTNKRVVQETPFRDGAASVSYATVEMIEELTGQVRDPRVLVVGLGEMGADVCRNLQGSEITNIVVMNRSIEKSERIAQECGYEIAPIEELWEKVQWADVIISSVARSEPLFDKDKVKELDVLSYKYFIDMSVPRSVAEDVESLPGIVVYNIDNIQSRSEQAIEKRKNAIPAVERIIEESLQEFDNWAKEMEVSPTIQKLKSALEVIRKEEISRHLKSLSENEVEMIDVITKNITQKIIKLPVLQLKAACKRGEAETLIDVLNDIFNLEKVDV